MLVLLLLRALFCILFGLLWLEFCQLLFQFTNWRGHLLRFLLKFFHCSLLIRQVELFCRQLCIVLYFRIRTLQVGITNKLLYSAADAALGLMLQKGLSISRSHLSLRSLLQHTKLNLLQLCVKLVLERRICKLQHLLLFEKLLDVPHFNKM